MRGGGEVGGNWDSYVCVCVGGGVVCVSLRVYVCVCLEVIKMT